MLPSKFCAVVVENVLFGLETPASSHETVDDSFINDGNMACVDIPV